jgi:hypothetical protein
MPATAATHPYFVDKARVALRRAGANPAADPMPLAQWAEAAKAADRTRAGVLATRDGRVVAETDHHSAPGRAGGTYIHKLHVDIGDGRAAGIRNRILDMGSACLSRELGEPVAHFKYWQLATN